MAMSGDGGGGGEKPPLGLDERTRQNMRIAEKIGSECFEQNTQILRGLAWRGLRAFFVFGGGVAAFAYAMRRQRSRKEAVDASGDPTQRYLEEMRGLGFDVDTVEEELEVSRRSGESA